jgi:hypothetical protein
MLLSFDDPVVAEAFCAVEGDEWKVIEDPPC